jgi:hypothetical protein
MEGGHETAVTGVGGLQHVQHLRTPDLADHDPVGPHPKGVADQFAQRHLAGIRNRSAVSAPHLSQVSVAKMQVVTTGL